MYSGKKALVFGIFGLAFGYFCHRLTLLYESLPHQPPLERLTYLLGEGQAHIFDPFWNLSFTKNSFYAFLLGFLT